MYICHCRAVTDATIETTISSGAATVDELARRCGAGSRCGGCWPALEELLASHTGSACAGINSRSRPVRNHAA